MSISKFDYYLTRKGAVLLPVLVEMADWGGKYVEERRSSELYKKVKKKKAEFLKNVTLELKKRVK